MSASEFPAAHEAAGQPAPAVETSAPAPLDWILVGLLTVLAILTAVYSTFFLPLYVGVVPVPISAVIGAGVLYWTIHASYRLTRSMKGPLAPAIGWLVVSVWLSLSRTFGYGLVIGDWRAMVLLGLGSLSAAVALSVCWGWQVAAQTVPVVTAREAAQTR